MRREGNQPQIPGVMRLVLAIFLSWSISSGYTVLTHEAISDSVWDASLQKLLLKRFPDATPEQLQQAHAYAYGGCIIQAESSSRSCPCTAGAMTRPGLTTSRDDPSAVPARLATYSPHLLTQSLGPLLRRLALQFIDLLFLLPLLLSRRRCRRFYDLPHFRRWKDLEQRARMTPQAG